MTHDLLIAKLHALNFNMKAINVIFDIWQEENKVPKLILLLPHI